MRARGKRRPGQPGTRAYMEIYGDRLVCVRYRYDAEQRRRYTTVEIIVAEGPWEPPRKKPAPDKVVYVRVGREEMDIRQQVKAAGGWWWSTLKLWSLPYATAERLGLLDRIVDPSPR